MEQRSEKNSGLAIWFSSLLVATIVKIPSWWKDLLKCVKQCILVNTNLCLFFSNFVWKGQIAWWEEITFLYVNKWFKGDGNIKGSIFMHYTVYGWREKMCRVRRESLNLKDGLLHVDIWSQNEVLKLIKIACTLWS